MLTNRSVPPCTVIPVLKYPDPTVAAEWLCNAFGFVVRLRIANHRIQLKTGPGPDAGCITVAEGPAPTDNTSHITQVRILDADSHCENARLNGAQIITPPITHIYGERQYNAIDFAGHRWDFTQTLVDVRPEDWGGESVNI